MSDEYYNKLKKEFNNFLDICKIQPNEKGIIELKLYSLIQISPFLVNNLLDDFYNVFPLMKNILFDKFNNQNHSPLKTINLISNKGMQPTPIEHLTKNKNNKLLKFVGFILSSSNVITEVTYNYTCSECGNKYISSEPLKECKLGRCRQLLSDDDCFKIIKHYRELVFQEQIKGRLFSETISMILPIEPSEDSKYITFPELFGNKLEITGVTKLIYAGKRNNKITFETIVQIYGIKKLQETKLKSERVIEVKKFIKTNKENIIKLCAEHIGCNIFGFKYEKQALLLTVVGLEKNCPCLSGRNTQMVTIMFSDAGKGKSNMSKAFMTYIPNSIYITSNTSKAGLVGGIEKTANGGYVFTMGEIPFANNSFILLDEIDNLDKEESDVLLTVISEGLLKVTKIKKFEMPIHVNFIIQGNPINSYFDSNIPFFSQLTLTRPFLDRGDFLIILHDPYDNNKNNEVQNFANAVLTNKESERKYPDQLIKDVLFYIKNYVPNPKLNEESNKAIIDYWIKLKHLRKDLTSNNTESKEDLRPVSARSLISLTKISLVVARFKMNEFVKKEDVDVAYNIYYNASIKNLLTDYGGVESYAVKTENIGKIVTKPKTQFELEKWILQKFSKQKDGMMEFDVLFKLVIEQLKLSEDIFNSSIKHLKQNGEVFSPKPHLIGLL